MEPVTSQLKPKIASTSTTTTTVLSFREQPNSTFAGALASTEEAFFRATNCSAAIPKALSRFSSLWRTEERTTAWVGALGYSWQLVGCVRQGAAEKSSCTWYLAISGKPSLLWRDGAKEWETVSLKAERYLYSRERRSEYRRSRLTMAQSGSQSLWERTAELSRFVAF